MSKSPGKLKPVLLCALLALAAVVGVVVDMGYGRQYMGFLLDTTEDVPPGEIGPLYHEGGIRIGQWQIVQPQLMMRPDGYMIEVLEDNIRVPILVGDSWYEDGTLEAEDSLFDASGAEVLAYPVNTASPKDLEPHARVVMRRYGLDGSELSETVWLKGVRQ